MCVSVLASLVVSSAATAKAGGRPGEENERPRGQKPRVVVMTDIGGDPDDQQSMVRFLLYSCDFEVEGLLTGLGHGHSRNTRPDLIRKCVEAYGRVLERLREHRSDYPSREHLLGLIKKGRDMDMHKVGRGMDSEASEWIIRVLDRPDPRPVWFSIWGGPRELAQALWKVQHTRSAAQLAAFKRKIRVHSINDQDRTAKWIKQNHPGVLWIFSRNVFRGMYASGDASLVSPDWLRTHVLSAHGPLGSVYPARAAGRQGVKEGDTPSFTYLIPNGLSDPTHPEWGNWGGRFRPSGRGAEYIDAADAWRDRTDPRLTVARWRQAYQNAFQARMDWCVKPYKQANHEPVAVCNGDKSRRVLKIDTSPGRKVRLSAAGSSDPDGDKLSYTWWVYKEAGTYWGEAATTGGNAVNAVVTVPREAAGTTIHVVLEVADSGRPPLTTYRRAVLRIPGGGAKPARGPGTFYRGININGRPIVIDGRQWEGDGAANFICKDRALVTRHVPLKPPTDAARAQMIRSFRWSRRVKIALTGVPEGTYAVYTYVFEDNNPETLSISLEGREVVRDYNSGAAGQWRKLGPWVAKIADGTITVTSRGGAANFSGIEVWRIAEDR